MSRHDIPQCENILKVFQARVIVFARLERMNEAEWSWCARSNDFNRFFASPCSRAGQALRLNNPAMRVRMHPHLFRLCGTFP